MVVGTSTRAAPSSSKRPSSTTAVDRHSDIRRPTPERPVRGLDDGPHRGRHPHLDAGAHEGLTDLGGETELSDVDIGIVVDQEMNGPDVEFGAHREIELDHDRYDPPVGR